MDTAKVSQTTPDASLPNSAIANASEASVRIPDTSSDVPSPRALGTRCCAQIGKSGSRSGDGEGSTGRNGRASFARNTKTRESWQWRECPHITRTQLSIRSSIGTSITITMTAKTGNASCPSIARSEMGASRSARHVSGSANTPVPEKLFPMSARSAHPSRARTTHAAGIRGPFLAASLGVSHGVETLIGTFLKSRGVRARPNRPSRQPMQRNPSAIPAAIHSLSWIMYISHRPACRHPFLPVHGLVSVAQSLQ
jgi:hypothetical protein